MDSYSPVVDNSADEASVAEENKNNFVPNSQPHQGAGVADNPEGATKYNNVDIETPVVEVAEPSPLGQQVTSDIDNIPFDNGGGLGTSIDPFSADLAEAFTIADLSPANLLIAPLAESSDADISQPQDFAPDAEPPAETEIEPEPTPDPDPDPVPPTISVEDFGDVLVFDGGLNNGNFVGVQSAEDLLKFDPSIVGPGGLGAIALVSFASNFTVSAPSAGLVSREITYGLELEVPEGTTLNANNLADQTAVLKSGTNDIYLFEVNGTIFGSTSPTTVSGNEVFRTFIDSSTGLLTFEQFLPIQHVNGIDTTTSDAATILDRMLLADNQIQLTARVTDDYGSGQVLSATAFVDLGGNIQFGDDGPGNPTLVVSGTEPIALTFDGGLTDGNFTGTELTGDTNASPVIAAVDFSSAFTTGNLSDFGADGPGTASTVSYSLALTGPPDSGLTSGGNAITLSESGGVITGTAGAAGTAFTLAVNSSGVVTLTQSLAIDHSQNDTYNGAYIDDVASLIDGRIQLNATATATTDSDGDSSSTATASLDLGGNIQFGDDGPGNPTLVVSGTEPIALTFDGGLTDGNFTGTELTGDTNASPVIAAVDFSSAFTTGNLSDFGADGPGTASTVSYSLALTGPPDSGLTSGGNAITLSESGGVITGTAGAAGTAFTLAVNSSGVVTLTQSLAIDHSQNDTYNGAYIDDVASLIDGRIQLNATATATTDSDGDSSSTATASLDLGGNIQFGDDGPGNPTLVVSGTEPIALTFDGGLTDGNFTGTELTGDTNASPVIAAVDFSSAFTTGNLSDFGADGPGTASTVSYSLALTGPPDSGLTSGGNAITLSESGGVITGTAGAAGTAFTLAVNSSGVVTLTQSLAIDHSQNDTYNGAYIDDVASLIDGRIQLNATATATTDSDGDSSSTATASLDLGGNIQFGDDGPGNPTLVVSGTEPIALTFDGGLTDGNFTGTELTGDTNASPVIAAVDFSSAFTTGNLSDFGADGPGTASTVSYSLALTGPPDSGLTSGGNAITLSESGGVITGTAGAAGTAFTLAVNSSGVVTLTQSLAIDHSQNDTYNGAYIDDVASLIDGRIQLNATATATTDSDGDSSSTATASLDLGGNIQFGDDGPGNPTLVVSGTEPIALTFDGGLTDGNFTGTELTGDTNASPVIAAVDFSSAFTTGNLSDFGADGPGTASTVSYSLALTGPPDSGLTSGGNAITLSESGGVITGTAGAAGTAFTLAVNSSGVVTLTQSLAIDHSQNDTYNGAYIDDVASLIDGRIQLNATATATTDSDGDSSSTATASLDLGGNIQFGDDGPGNPTLVVSGTEPIALTFDGGLTDGNFTGTELTGDTNASPVIAAVDFSSAFTTGNLSDFGADGPGTASTVSYSLALTGPPDSGLTSGGNAITLSESGGVITGTAGAAGTAFTLAVNSSGVVTLTQSLAIDHSQNDTYNGAYIDDVASLIDGRIQLNATATATTDSDGDSSSTATASLDLGGNIQFGDDGPGNPTLVVSGTEPIALTFDGGLTDGNFTGTELTGDTNASPVIAAVDFSSAFTTGNLSDFGADGPGTASTVSYSLALTGPPDSGLTSGGNAITLSESGGVITGTAGAAGTAFTLAVNSSGVVTLTQSLAIDHSQNDTYNGAYIDDVASLIDGRIQLNATATATTDSDGDSSSTATASLDLGGNIQFGDDGPGNPTLVVSGTEPIALTFDGGLTDGNFTGTELTGDTNASPVIAAVDFSSAFTTGNLSDFGADGPGTASTVSYSLALTGPPDSGLTSGGNAITLSESGGVITGTAGAAGTAFTLAVNSSGVVTLTQSLAIDHSQNDTYNGAYIDDVASLIDGRIQLNATATATTDSDGDSSSTATASLDLGGNIQFGDDGPGNPTLVVSGTEPIALTFDGGLTDGNFTGTELTGDTNASPVIAAVDFSSAFTTGNLSDFGADGPGTASTVSYSLALTGPPDSGLTSGGNAITLSESGGVITGTAGAAGTAFTLAVNSSGVVTLTQSLAIDHSQNDTYNGAYIDDVASLIDGRIQLNATATATTDSDGDSSSTATASLDLGGNIQFGDDGPGNPTLVVSGTEPIALTFDGGLTDGNFTGTELTGDTNASPVIAAVDFSSAFTTGNLSDFGADGPGTASTVSYSLALTGPPDSGLTSGGNAITLSESGGVITGTAGAAGTAFTLAVNSSGVVTLTQSLAIDHSQNDTYNGAYIDDVASLIDGRIQLNATATATTDSDGDSSSTATASLDLGGNIQFGDDGPGNPTLVVSGTEPIALTFDGGLTDGNFTGTELTGDTNASPVIAAVDFSSAFTTGNLSDFGADGPGTASTVSYSLALTGPPDSGLTSGGNAITLSESGGVITGTAGAAGTAFTLAVNSSGVVTLTQSLAIDHSQNDTYNGAYIDDVASLIDGRIQLNATATATTDSDGDSSSTATASLDLGGNIQFGDDGPGNPTLVVSGTEPIALTFDGGLTDGNFTGTELTGDTNASPVIAAVDFSSAFTTGNLSDFGADGPGTASTVSYSLALTGPPDSGLTSGGNAITLSESGGVITGTAGAAGTAFTLAVNSSGVVTLTQSLAIDHSQNDTYNGAYIDDVASLIDGRIQLNATATATTDSDGDSSSTATASLDLGGNIQFGDDGPGNPTLVVSGTEPIALTFDGGLTDGNFTGTELTGDTNASPVIAAVDFSSAFTTGNLSDFGADGPGTASTVSYSLALTGPPDSGLTSGGNAITLSESGGVITGTAGAAGTAFTLAVNSSGVVTLTQSLAIDHSQNDTYNGAYIDDVASLIDGRIQLNATATATTDSDGDSSSTATASLDLGGNIQFGDDGPGNPTLVVSGTEPIALTFDGGLTDGNFTGTELTGDTNASPVIAAVDFSSAFTTGNLSDFGADGPGTASTVSYSLALTGPPDSGLTSGGNAITLSESGGVITGTAGAAGTAFTLAVNSSGVVTLTQSLAIDHSQNDTYNGAYIDDVASLIDGRIQLNATATATTDSDGDSSSTATASLDLGGNIQFGDDGPGNPTLVVSGTEPIALTFDGGLTDGNFTGTELTGDTNASPVIAAVDFSSAFTTGNLSDFGADGPGTASTVSYSLALTGPPDSGLTSGGNAITLSESGGVITGTAGAAGTAFTLAVNSSGVVTLTQSLAIDHSQNDTYNGAYIDDVASLIDGRIQLNATATATTDSDGDSSSTATASLDLGGNIQFGDDGPGNPTLVVSGTEPIALTFDGGLTDGNFTGTELTGDTNASPVIAAVDFSSAFTTGNLSDFGADGPGTASTVSYSLALTGPPDSGLTSGGNAITLSESGGVITGTAGAAGTAFTLAVNSSGVVTLTQSLAIDHSQNDTYNGAYIDDVASLIDGRIQLNATATATTDSDGDSSSTATASLDLGGNIQFGDDGPGNPTLVVSGTEPIALTFDGGLTDGNFTGTELTGDTNASPVIAAVDFSSAFTTGNLSDFGADGPGTASTVSYSLALTGPPDSGLTSGGNAITLSESGGVITGTAGAAGTAFTLAVNSSGVVTLTQSLAIDHSQNDTYNGAYIDDVASLIDGRIQLNATATATTDSDGDSSSTATASLDLGGNIQFGDDGPGNPTLVVSGTEPIALTFDGGLTDGNFTGTELTGDTNASPVIAAVDFSSAFTTGNLSDFGADGPGTASTVSYSLALTGPPDSGLTSGGNAITLSESGGVITGTAGAAGTAFTLAVNSSGVVTLTQSLAIDHSQNDTYNGAYIDDVASLIDGRIQLNATATATTDSDGDSSSTATASLDLGGNIQFGDDGPGNPTLVVSGTEPIALTFDGGLTDGNFTGTELTGDTNASPVIAAVDFSSAFTTGNLSDFGADGPGTASTVSYSLALTGPPDSGLTSGGNAITLSESGGVITGTAGAAGTAFTLAVNSSGVVTLTQSLAIDHSQNDTYNGAYIDDVASLIDGRIQLNATATATTDSDGDSSSTATASLDLGGNIQFGDDGPGNPTLVVSGTEPIALTFDGGLTDGNFTGTELTGDTNASPVIAAVDFSSAFTTGNLSDFGADGPGTASTVSYSLALTGPPDSGLTSGGNAITLSESGGVITGTAGAAGTAFTLAVNSSGVVTLTQSLAIDHSQNDTYNGAYIDDVASLIDGRIQLNATATATTDSDGDSSSTATASLDLGGNIQFGDDGPGNPTLVVSGTEPIALTFDGGLTDGNFTGTELTGDTNASPVIAAVDFSSAFTTGNLSDFGADGPGTASTVSYSLALTGPPDSGLTSGGNAITLSESGGVITGTAGAAGTAFTLAVNSSGVVTLTQSLAIDHSQNDTYNGAYIDDVASLIDGRIQLNATATATTDSDGDSSSTATASLDLGGNIQFGDDGPGNPTLVVSGTEPIALTFDGGLTDGNFTGTELTGDTNASPVIAAVDFSSAFTTGNLSDFGADGPGTASTVSYSLALTGPPDSGLTSGGNAITLSESGGVITGTAGAAGTAFTLAVNSSGVVTLTQSLAIDHSQNDTYNGAYIDDVASLIDGRIQLNATATATTDSDGDSSSTATASLDLGGNIQFGDDGPGNPTLVVSGTEPIALTFDGGLTDGNFTGTELTGDTNASPVIAAVDFSSAFTTGNLSDFGADGPGTASTVSYSLALTGPPDSGLTSGGNAITLSESGGVITGTAGAAGTAFTLAVNSSGVVTLTQSLAIDHSQNDTYNGAYIDDVASLIDGRIQLNATATATTDSDGDSSSTATASLDLGGNIQFGDDGPGNPTLVVSGTEPIALTFDGGLTDGNFTGTELTGDTNASPVIAAVDFSSAFTTGNLSDFGADGPGTASTVSYSLALTGPPDSGLTSGGNAITLSESGGVITGTAGAAGTAFTLAVNSSGVVTLTQSLAIDHSQNDTYNGAYIDDVASLIDGRIQLNATATATTDSDGDSSSTATASLDLGGNIQFGDDGPGNPTLVVSGTEPIALTFDGGLTDGNFTGTELTGDTNASPVIAAVDFSSAFTTGNLSDFGADGPGTASTVSYSLALTGPPDSGLTSGGNAITLSESGGVITGTAGAAGTAFTLAVNSSGVVTLTQSLAIDHSQNDTYNGAYIDDVASLIDGRIQLNATATATTDSDGDSSSTATASLDLGGNIQFGDDGPGNPTLVVSGTEPIALTFDGGLTDGNFTGTELTGDTNASPVIAAVDFSSAFTTGNLSDFGADGPGTASTVSYSLALTGPPDSGLTSGGNAITLSESGGVITGTAGAAGTAFTLAVNSSGVVTLTQSLAIDHSQNDTYNGAYIDDVASLIDGRIQLNATATATTDSDGDSSSTATASLDLGGNIQFGDDGPEIDPGIFTASQELVFNVVVGDDRGDNNINGTPNFNYSDFSRIPLNFDSIYANQTITIDLDVVISGSWNYDGVGDSSGNVFNNLFDDNWSIFIPDNPTQEADWLLNGGPGSNATADQIYFYNANAGATGYPQAEPFYDNLATQGITYAPPSNVNTNFTFSHTVQVTGTLDSNGDFEFWVGGETTQTDEIATIQGISNVQLTGPQLPGEVLIQAGNINATYANQNLASWDFGADGIYAPNAYSITGLTSGYIGAITQSSAQSVVITISKAGNNVAVLNLNSDSTASDSLEIISTGTGQAEEFEFDFNVKDGDQDIDSITFDINLSAPNTISAGTQLYRDEFTNSDSLWTTPGSFENNPGELEIRRNSGNNDNRAEKTFEFGSANSGRDVNVSFETETRSSWESNDEFKVFANGSEVISESGETNTTLNFTSTLDANGRLEVTIIVLTSSGGERLRIDNFTITSAQEFIETSFLTNLPNVNPISIDLDNDGKIDYLSRGEGQSFEDAETNVVSNIAWVAPNDGLLVIDADQSGSINETREFAFTEWSNNAETDLQAVAEVFDTNQDGILDAQDERFDEFAVWQDLNSDAITDEGELSSLSELGINSINLTYRDDSESRVEVGGDVTVFGQATVSYEDGSTALAEDTSFARSIVSDPSSTADPTASDTGDQAETTQLASQDLSSEVSITALVNQFLETNPAEDDLIAQVHQELMDDGEPDSNPINLESLDDASYGDEDYDAELDLEIETIDLSNTDLMDEMPLDFAEVYSSQA